MINRYDKQKTYIKEEIFRLVEKMYEGSLLACEGVNGWNQKEIDDGDKMNKEAFDSIIWRIDDYHDFEDAEVLGEDVDFSELNFNDYSNL